MSVRIYPSQSEVGGGAVPYDTRTSNTILATGDNATLIDITANTFTQTVTAAATLGSMWSCYYKNSGSGVITIDPNSSETIDGVATATIESGDTFLIQSDGTNLQCTKVGGYKAHYITADDGTWPVPAGVNTLSVIVIAGGGGGGWYNSAGSSGPCGGGGGGFTQEQLELAPGTTVSITVGAGGAKASVAGTVGTDGETSSFGAYCSATGGDGGGNYLGGQGGLPGEGSGGDMNFVGGKGGVVGTIGSAGGSYMSPTLTYFYADSFPASYPGGGGMGRTNEAASVAEDGADGLVIIWY